MKKVITTLITCFIFYNSIGQVFSIEELLSVTKNNDYPKSLVSLCIAKGFIRYDFATPTLNTNPCSFENDTSFTSVLTKYNNGEQSMMITFHHGKTSKYFSIEYYQVNAGYQFNLSEIKKEWKLTKSLYSINNPLKTWSGYIADIYQRNTTAEYFVVYHSPQNKEPIFRIEYMDMKSFQNFCITF